LPEGIFATPLLTFGGILYTYYQMSQSWIFIAIISAACMGMVNILDSHLIARRMPGFRSYLLAVSIFVLGWGIAICLLNPLPSGLGTIPLIVAVTAGLLRGSAVIIMLYTMKREEISRIIPIVYVYPILDALMAVPMFGEQLLMLDWIAILAVVGGAVVVSLRINGGGMPLLGRSFYLLMLSSLMLAASDLVTKYTLSYLSYWNVFWITSFCMSGIFLVVSLRPDVWKALACITQRKQAWSLIAFNECLAMTGAIAFFMALNTGPVSLVTTINSTRPAFVLLFAFIFSLVVPSFLKWQGGRKALLIKLGATVMIVGGVAIIYLT